MDIWISGWAVSLTCPPARALDSSSGLMSARLVRSKIIPQIGLTGSAGIADIPQLALTLTTAALNSR